MGNFTKIIKNEDDEEYKKSFKKFDEKSKKRIIEDIQSLRNNKQSEIEEDSHNEYDEEFWNKLKQSFKNLIQFESIDFDSDYEMKELEESNLYFDYITK